LSGGIRLDRPVLSGKPDPQHSRRG
jgi:hypothetical protein